LPQATARSSQEAKQQQVLEAQLSGAPLRKQSSCRLKQFDAVNDHRADHLRTTFEHRWQNGRKNMNSSLPSKIM